MKHLRLFFLLMSFLLYCKENSVFIEVDGKKITEADLIKEMPEQFKSLRSEYESKVKELIKELAHRRMFEKEAKEKGISVNDYFNQIQDNSPNPTEEEVNNFYKKLKESGQAKNIEEKDLKARIAQYLKQEKAQLALTEEISKLKKKYKYKEPIERIQINITKDDPVKGNPEGKIVIVEFSDFECPFCLRSQDTIKQILNKYGTKVKWVFKDFPLDFHQNAKAAHIAANCVHQLKPDQFWNFYDIIFHPNRNKEVFNKEFLRANAIKLGVSATNYDSCFSDPKTWEKIQKNIEEGMRVGVTGTPAFFINGRKISGAQPFAVFEEIILEEFSN
ncbi:MAG: DsbA family protein [Leptonema sp. (in: bacteria)]